MKLTIAKCLFSIFFPGVTGESGHNFIGKPLPITVKDRKCSPALDIFKTPIEFYTKPEEMRTYSVPVGCANIFAPNQLTPTSETRQPRRLGVPVRVLANGIFDLNSQNYKKDLRCLYFLTFCRLSKKTQPSCLLYCRRC
jgi:hypothetical protein